MIRFVDPQIATVSNLTNAANAIVMYAIRDIRLMLEILTQESTPADHRYLSIRANQS